MGVHMFLHITRVWGTAILCGDTGMVCSARGFGWSFMVESIYQDPSLCCNIVVGGSMRWRLIFEDKEITRAITPL